MFLVLAFASIPFSYDGTVRSGQRVEIRDVNGNVRVHPGRQLSIRATKHGKHSDPAQVAVRVEPGSDGVVVCVRYPPEPNRPCADRTTEVQDNDVAVDFDVTVPAGIVLVARTVNGWVDVRNDGPVEAATTVNGYAKAEGTDVRDVQTVNGSVDVRIVGARHGDLSARTVNGGVTIALPAGAGAQISAKTLNGDIRVGLPVDRARFGPGARADGTLGDGAYRLRLESLNGSIELRR